MPNVTDELRQQRVLEQTKASRGKWGLDDRAEQIRPAAEASLRLEPQEQEDPERWDGMS